MERLQSRLEGQDGGAPDNTSSHQESQLSPGVTSGVAFLRGLRYQAPVELYSLDGTYVGYRRKVFSEEVARQRKRDSTKHYMKSEKGKPKVKAAQQRYSQTGKGRKVRNEASNRWYHRHNQQQ
jgi:hypothetical protein